MFNLVSQRVEKVVGINFERAFVKIDLTFLTLKLRKLDLADTHLYWLN